MLIVAGYRSCTAPLSTGLEGEISTSDLITDQCLSPEINQHKIRVILAWSFDDIRNPHLHLDSKSQLFDLEDMFLKINTILESNKMQHNDVADRAGT